MLTRENRRRRVRVVTVRDVRVLISVGADDLPGRRDAARHTQLDTLRTGRARLDDRGRIVRIRRTRVRAVEPIDSGGELQIWSHVPLRADFVVGELLRLRLLGERRERRELIA